MKTKLIKLITIIITLIGFLGLSVAPAFADTNCSDVCCSDAPASVKAAAGCPNAPANPELPEVIRRILNIIIGVLGIVAVVVIIYGGVQYMTSTGDANKTKKARETILYAVIGLIICALAFAVVNFTVNIINSNSSSAYLMQNSIAFLEKTL